MSSTVALPNAAGRRANLADVADLLGLLALALLAPALVLLPIPPLLRLPLGVALVLFAPGYALQALLFARGSLDGVARAALSVGLSIALVPLLALLLNALPWGIRPLPITLALAATVGLLALAALVRRARWPVQVATAPAPRRWPLALAASTAAVALASALLIWLTAAPPAAPTEFYALGSQSMAESYPREAVVGEPVALTLGIASHEPQQASYRVAVRSAGAELLRTQPITLAPGAVAEQQMQFALPQAGDDQVVEIVLLADGQDEPYRRLQLILNVRGDS
ncbi:DUF1616 domain-containing protein [Chloroflexia bacterium SDU3-3]|nr:DUF1616 domain-containing protein [Chloroflexia bacterium SDU3-3]